MECYCSRCERDRFRGWVRQLASVIGEIGEDMRARHPEGIAQVLAEALADLRSGRAHLRQLVFDETANMDFNPKEPCCKEAQ